MRLFESTVSCSHPQPRDKVGKFIWPDALTGSLLWRCVVPAQCFGHRRWLKSKRSSALSSPSSIIQTQASHKCTGFCVQWACILLSLTATVKTDGQGSPQTEFYFLFPQAQTLVYSLLGVAISNVTTKAQPRKGERLKGCSPFFFLTNTTFCHRMALFNLSSRVLDLWMGFLTSSPIPYVTNIRIRSEIWGHPKTKLPSDSWTQQAMR